MKRITSFFSILLLALTAMAQGVSFGHFQRKQQAKAHRQARIERRAEQTTRAIIAPIEEYQEVDLDENRRYRYVYAYNTSGDRASETIYMQEFDGDTWSKETLYTVGTYTYEYDTQGRVKTKSVTYDPEDDYGKFEPYRVMVSYADDGSATYTKYNRDYDNTYTEVENWTYRADGSLAEHNVAEYEGSESFDIWKYDTQGNVTNYNNFRLSGTLNDVNILYENEFIPETNDIEHYTYDGKTGKLLEYWYDNGSWELERYTFEYDAKGRIVSIKEYVGESEEDDDVDVDYPTIEVSTETGMETRIATSVDDIVWELSYEENYTYFNDEVYAVNNSWKAVFNMDGPVTNIVYKEYDTYEYEVGSDLNGDGVINELDNPSLLEYESTVVFTRNTDGKLTAVKTYDKESDGTTTESDLSITIDNEGQITNMKSEYSELWTGGYDEEGNWDESIKNSSYSLNEQAYTWSGGKITRMTDHEKWEYIYEGHSDNGEYTYQTLYTYTDNGIVMTKAQQDVDGAGAEITSIEQVGSRYMLKHWYDYGTTIGEAVNFDWEMDDYVIRDIQTEDVSFIRPNVQKDREGFTPEIPIILSRAGRVVCVNHGSTSTSDKLWYCEYDNQYYYRNVEIEENEYSFEEQLTGIYYSISHDGDLTVASNVKGLPIYVLKGSRLLKEYRYYDYDYDYVVPVGPESEMETRSVTIPAGQAYDEISYLYNDNDLLVGMQLVSVDEDGVRTGEITLEYKYDASGIATPELTATPHATIHGRTLGLSNGNTFCIYTPNGQIVASDVASYTFASSGLYLIGAEGKTIKVIIK